MSSHVPLPPDLHLKLFYLKGPKPPMRMNPIHIIQNDLYPCFTGDSYATYRWARSSLLRFVKGTGDSSSCECHPWI